MLPQTNDHDLVHRVIAGEIAAYRVLVERHQGGLFRMALGYLGDRHEAEDVVQEVFLAAYQHLSRYDRRRGKFFTWLAVIGRNRCLNRLRRQQPSPLPLAEISGGETPQETVERGEWFEAFEHAMRLLPAEQRAAFVLAEVEQLSYEQIAAIESVPVGTVKSRLARAREKLRAAIDQPTEGSRP